MTVKYALYVGLSGLLIESNVQAMHKQSKPKQRVGKFLQAHPQYAPKNKVKQPQKEEQEQEREQQKRDEIERKDSGITVGLILCGADCEKITRFCAQVMSGESRVTEREFNIIFPRNEDGKRVPVLACCADSPHLLAIVKGYMGELCEYEEHFKRKVTSSRADFQKRFWTQLNYKISMLNKLNDVATLFDAKGELYNCLGAPRIQHDLRDWRRQYQISLSGYASDFICSLSLINAETQRAIQIDCDNQVYALSELISV